MKEHHRPYLTFLSFVLFVGTSVTGQDLPYDPSVADEIFNRPPDEIVVSSTTSPITINNEDGSCICVPYYLCDPDGNNIIQDGTLDGFGKLDVRFKGECSESVEVCCKEPRTPDNPVKPVEPQKPVEQGCGIRNDLGVDFQIIGGVYNDSEFAEFPWTVAILNSADGSSACAGSLIHHRVVLTAAHCVKNRRPLELKVRAGEWDTQTDKERIPFQERPIERFVVHPNFNDKTLAYDVALVFVKTPFDKADNIDTICLPEQNENVDNYKECFATGWGKTRFGKQGRYSIIMKKVQMDMVPHQKCQQQFKKTRLGQRFTLHETFACAGGIEGVDTCQGDGGAPLVCPKPNKRYYQTGIVAWGVGCGAKDVPGAYGRVPSFRKWIDDQMTQAGYNKQSYTA